MTDGIGFWVLENCMRIFSKPDGVLDAEDGFAGNKKDRLMRTLDL
jgi:hypothetical protein